MNSLLPLEQLSRKTG